MNSYQALSGARNLPNSTQRKYHDKVDKTNLDRAGIRETLLADIEKSRKERKRELRHNRELVKSIQMEKL